MICPLCASTEITLGCCGDTHSACRRCGHRWDAGVSEPCPVPPAMRPGVFDADEVAAELAKMRETEPDAGRAKVKGEPLREVPPISDYQLWGTGP